MRKCRALWLMNDGRLREFEVPLLVELGYEVFCPKIYPLEEEYLTASVDDSYDTTLSIPKKILDYLNGIDFYKEIPRKAMECINEYFNVAFFGFVPEQLKMLVKGFTGIIVMRTFGLPAGTTYTETIEQELGIPFFESLEGLGKRFFFAHAYENLIEPECRYFKNRAIYLPMGLKKEKKEEEWIGDNRQILFVCPRIKTSAYFNSVYTDFKKNFANFDYVVGGMQLIEVKEDKHVAGDISREHYEDHMNHLAVMFYHSQEKRFLHRYPLEAVNHGMPLIFMSGGLLDELAESELPGSCKTIHEARKKIKRILNGDKAFIDKIKETQKKLIRPFQYEACRKQWNKEIKKISSMIARNDETRKTNKRHRIGILLTEGYTGGVLDYTLRFMKCMLRGIEESGKEIDLVFGYLDHDNFKAKDYFYEIEEAGISVRTFTWKKVSEEYLDNVMKYRGWHKTYLEGEYCLADDGIHFFEDCDFLILSVANIPANFFTIKPYAVVAHDYIQRYVPELYGNFYEKNVIDLERNAEAVIVMTQPALEDGIQYAGLKKDKLRLTPLMFDAVYLEDDKHALEQTARDYFVWSTNTQRHKNHIMALNALAQYYVKGGKLACYITGTSTMELNPEKMYDDSNSYICKIRRMIEEDPLLKENLVFCGNMDKEKYYRVLKHAKFFMHPGITDNGNMTAIDAAFLGVPTITSDYPAMRYYEEKMKLKMCFFDPFKAEELIHLLIRMEKDYKKHAQLLPKTEELEKYTLKYTYKELFDTVTDIFNL